MIDMSFVPETTMSPTTRTHWIVPILVVTAVFESYAQTYHFRGIGHLDNVRGYSEVTAVSGDGKVAVGTSTSASGFAAFQWTEAAGIEHVPLPRGWGLESIALDVNADGRVIVGQAANASFSSEAFIWEDGVGPRGLGFVLGRFSAANAVSPDGKFLVGVSGNADVTVVIWDGEGARDIGRAPWFAPTLPKAISNDSLIVGYGYLGYEDTRVFQWTSQRGFESPFRSDSLGSRANDVSADGSVVVGSIETPAGWRAYCRIGKTTTLLDPDQDGHALAVSNNGRFVVGFLTDGGRYHAFLWDELRGVQPLEALLIANGVNPGRWKLLYATGVSDSGRVIGGYGINPSHTGEGWMIRIDESRPATDATSIQADAHTRP